MLTSSNISPLILGFSGTDLSQDVRQSIEELRPAGFILFGRNVDTPEQLKRLCDELRVLSPLTHPLIFIDQEGGRVRRLNFPEMYQAPDAQQFGKIFQQNPQQGLEAVQWSAYLTARELHALGVTVNCMPVADLMIDGAHSIIGDRAYSADPHGVASLCAAAIKGTMAGGVWPVIKHAPGHGRATVDSHAELPHVEADLQTLENDLLPFKTNHQCPFVMTAHVTYPAFDNSCATTSPQILQKVLRQQCAMTGTFVADDVFMKALNGDLHTRVANSLHAGCDLVICGSSNIDGRFSEDMWRQIDALNSSFALTDKARERLQNLPTLPHTFDVSVEEAKQELKQVMAV